MAHEEEALGKAYDSRLMRRLLAYLRPYRGKVILAILVTIFLSVLGPLRPLLVMMAIDKLIIKDMSGFYTIVALIVGSIAIQALVQYLQTIITQWIGQKTIYNIRREIVAKLGTLSMRFFDKNPVGRLVTRLTSDVEVLNELFSSGIIMVFADVFVIVWIFVFMLLINLELSLVVMAIFPILLIATSLFRKKARESYREVRMQVAKMNAYLNEHVSGMITVQLYGQEQRTFDEFSRINRDHANANIKSVFYYAVFFPTVEFFSSVAFGLIIWYGGGLVLQTQQGGLGEFVSLSTLIAFIQYTEMFFRPLRDLADKYNILQGAMASSERIFKLLDDDTKILSPNQAVPIKHIQGGIEFRNVSFAYNSDDYVLSDISLKVNPGETVAFVGATGAGKSSITNLITRFYEFQQGDIFIDGVDIRSFDPKDLRKHIGIVLQDVVLFNADVETNITLGNEAISPEKARWAAETVGAARFIERLPNGYKTNVKERGAILSVGEKQLLSFARALAYDPRILILDEATSSIDTESEILIQQAIETLLKGRTSIVIAHRLSTIQKADKIVVLHKGEIRETGSHDELLRLNGIYRKLYELQYKEQEVGSTA